MKPDDWLEGEESLIPDPKATKPNDWDDEMDGEWEAPKIDNPKCKKVSGCGKWKRPMIPNPAYKVNLCYYSKLFTCYIFCSSIGLDIIYLSGEVEGTED